MPSINTMFGAGIGGTAPHSNYAQTPSVPTGSELGINVGGGLEGIPARVATIIILAVAGLAGLKWAGFKFNVTAGG